MNDIEFIETLKQKRNACDYSQSRLAQELQISRQNLNEIENGKTKASKEMKHILLHYLDYCNCTQPFTLTIDYLRVRFPTTDALEIIKNVLAMKSEYFIHEDYGMFGYEEQYIYGDISVNASKDSSMGVLLELRGMGCRNLEYVLQARGIDWYYFLSSCIDYQGVFKRIDLAVNDMGGLLDIEILRERYYANKVWKRSRTHEAVDSGKLSGTHGDTAKTFYIGSKNSSIYFCLYEKEKEQKSKGIKTDIKNRFEIRLKSGKAEQTIEQLVFSRNPEQTIASLILTQIDFPVYILWDIFLDNVTTSLADYAENEKGILLKRLRIISIVGLCSIIVGFVMLNLGTENNMPVYDYIMGTSFGLAMGALIVAVFYSTGVLSYLRKNIKCRNSMKVIKIIAILACAVFLAASIVASL